jgi:hypothetical protein
VLRPETLFPATFLRLGTSLLEYVEFVAHRHRREANVRELAQPPLGQRRPGTDADLYTTIELAVFRVPAQS